MPSLRSHRTSSNRSQLESPGEAAPAAEALAEGTPALDELSDWVSADAPTEPTSDFGPDDDIFDTGGLTFLDSDDESPLESESPLETDAELDGNTEAEIQTEMADSDSSAPQRAEWLDELDGTSGADWIDSLPEGAAEEVVSTTVDTDVDDDADSDGTQELDPIGIHEPEAEAETDQVRGHTAGGAHQRGSRTHQRRN